MVGDIGEISICQSGEDVIAEWRIANFFSLSERDSAWYCSPAFSFGGETWYLEMLPNGWSNCDSSGHVDLHLWNDSSDQLIRQEFSLSLKAVKGEKYNEEHCTKDFDDYDYSHELNLFVPRSELSRRQSELVPDGVLTVVCTMKNTTSAGSDSKPSYAK